MWNEEFTAYREVSWFTYPSGTYSNELNLQVVRPVYVLRLCGRVHCVHNDVDREL